MTVRQIAIELLDEYELASKYVNLALNSHKLDALTIQDRGFLTALFYTTVERKITYDYYISSVSKRSTEKIDIHTLNILRLGVCQLLDMDNLPTHAAVNETVLLGRHKGERAFINAVLRKIAQLSSEDNLPLPEKNKNIARYFSVYYSFPLKLVKFFISEFGEEQTEKLFGAFNSTTYTDITVNTALISRNELISRLKEQGISAEKSERSSLSIRLNGLYNPRTVFGFDEGYFFVQDGICSLSVEALGIKNGDKVLDVCACPGGKSFAAAILAGREGSVLSLDLHESKLSLIESGKVRLKLYNINVKQNDATEINPEYIEKFDKIICDVPCSGLGVLGKKPDIRYKDFSSMNELPETQYKILETSAKYLRQGGELIYSTCTLNKKENEEVAERFLLEHSEFSPVEFKFSDIVSRGGKFTAYPHIHNTDGFFICKMRKN